MEIRGFRPFVNSFVCSIRVAQVHSYTCNDQGISQKCNKISARRTSALSFIEKVWNRLLRLAEEFNRTQSLCEECRSPSACLSRGIVPNPFGSIAKLPVRMRVQLSIRESEGGVLSRAQP